MVKQIFLVLKVIIESTGAKTLQALNALDGIELAKIHSPNLILMDISLPGIDGITAIKMLKDDEITQNIPIIAVTAHAMKDDEKRILDAGSDGYITKPIDTRKFMQTISKYLL